MRFYGQWNPPVDKVLFENYFKNKTNGFFIECGAYNGKGLSCCKFFEDTLKWKGINVEPAKNHFAALTNNRPNSINLNVGLSDKNEILKFKNVICKPGKGKGAGNGSFQHSKNHMKELRTYGVTFEEYDVQTITYAEMIEEHEVSKVDLMCLDVEGFEFKVIDGMKDASVLPSVLCIEYSYLGLENVKEYVKELDYTYDFISFNNAYFHRPDAQLPKHAWFGSTNKECCVVNGSLIWKDLK